MAWLVARGHFPGADRAFVVWGRPDAARMRCGAAPRGAAGGFASVSAAGRGGASVAGGASGVVRAAHGSRIAGGP
ncbi:hypothetical protein A3L22_25810 [Streptomyces griseus subsp. griseus]|nr:hypothetical protein A3L22_25810 [Streptomyces griseus subsp. griseus]